MRRVFLNFAVGGELGVDEFVDLSFSMLIPCNREALRDLFRTYQHSTLVHVSASIGTCHVVACQETAHYLRARSMLRGDATFQSLEAAEIEAPLALQRTESASMDFCSLACMYLIHPYDQQID